MVRAGTNARPGASTVASHRGHLRGDLPPHGHVAQAVAREGVTLPRRPSIMEFQPGQLRHEVELGWPDVPERDGHPIVSAFDEPEMMRDEPLTRDVVLVDPPVKLA